MLLLAITAILSLAIALPTFRKSDSGSNATTISADTMHANILASYPADRIVSSADLHQYFHDHIGDDYLIYISDKGEFVDLADVQMAPASNSSIGKRQGIWSSFTTYNIQNARTYWSAWTPASACLTNGLDGADGGSVSIQYSYSTAVQISGGVTFNMFEGALSASVGFSVTDTFSIASTYTCPLPATSVLQVWEQEVLSTADIYSTTCQMFNGVTQSCAPAQYYGGLTAPPDPSTNKFALGCSAGWDHVQCGQ